jgi:radical SAM protein with 4Fe4S-binding SPASM domain
MSVEIATPFLVQLHLVKRCVFKCDYCYLHSLSDKDTLSVEEAMDFLDKLSAQLRQVCGENEIILNLIGGDIIQYYPRLEELMKKIEQTDYVSGYTLALNSLWDSKIDIAKYHKLSRVQLNTDVPTEQLLVDIKMIIKAKKFVNLKLNLSRNSAYLDSQIRKLIKLREAFGNHDLLQLSLDRLCPTDKVLLNARLDNVELKKILSELKNTFNPSIFINEDPMLEGYFNPPEKVESDSIYGCSIGRSSVTVYPDKQIKLCARIPSFLTGYDISNFDLISFLTLVSEIRDKNLKKCDGCKYYKKCLGGCPATSYLDDKKITYDHNCYMMVANGK